MTPEQQKALAVARARRRRQASGPVKNADGTYGQAPADMFMNPATGQMTSREMIGANTETSAAGAGLRGAAAGVLFGFDDEIGALHSYLTGDQERAKLQLEQARAKQDVDADQHPIAAAGGKIAGALVPAAASAPLAVGKGVLGTMARGASIGALEGAAHGAGGGEGLEGRVNGAAWGSGVGGVVGGAAPAVIAGVKSAANPALAMLTRKPSEAKVRRGLLDTLRQSGRSADDVATEVAEAGLEGQGEFRLMDALGSAGQRRAAGVVRAGGDGATELAEFLEKRQLGQPERVGGFLEDAFGFRGSNAPASGADLVPQGHTFVDAPSDVLRRPVRSAAGLTSDLTKARSIAANEAYDAARGNAAPVDVRSALRVIDDRIGGMKGSGVTGDGIDAKLAGYRSRLAADAKDLAEGETARELSDFDRVLGVKQAVQDDVGSAVRAGRNNEARELGKLVSALDEALEGASDGYRAANDGFREASGVIDAVEQGRQMARPANRAADTTAQFSAMTPDQQAAARVGYGDTLLGKLEAGTAPTANRAKALQSPKVEAERGILAIDPDLLARRVDRENAMWGVQNRALGGSRTADNLADIGDTQQITEGLLGALIDVGNLNAGSAVRKAAQAIGPVLRGENEATRHALAEALMSADPQAVLGPAVKKQMEVNLREGLLTALMRQPSREALTP